MASVYAVKQVKSLLRNTKLTGFHESAQGDWKGIKLFLFTLFWLKKKEKKAQHSGWLDERDHFLSCNATVLTVGFTAEASHHFKPSNRSLGDGTLQN